MLGLGSPAPHFSQREKLIYTGDKPPELRLYLVIGALMRAPQRSDRVLSRRVPPSGSREYGLGGEAAGEPTRA